MPGIIHFETFLITGILLNLTPGNDTLFILSRSIAMGKKAGIVSVLGIATGSLVHTTLAAFGLSIIITKSILIFDIIKYAGAAYLVFVGIKMLAERSRLNFSPGEKTARVNGRIIYRDAVLTNVLNPKVAMFFIAFLPQFIDPGYHNPVLPFLVLGISFTITGTAWCLTLAIFSSKIFSKLKENQKFSLYLNKICGFVLIGLGIKVALTNRKL
jgi:threonine/homoserine/homoserine lactone efflux protein